MITYYGINDPETGELVAIARLSGINGEYATKNLGQWRPAEWLFERASGQSFDTSLEELETERAKRLLETWGITV